MDADGSGETPLDRVSARPPALGRGVNWADVVLWIHLPPLAVCVASLAMILRFAVACSGAAEPSGDDDSHWPLAFIVGSFFLAASAGLVLLSPGVVLGACKGRASPLGLKRFAVGLLICGFLFLLGLIVLRLCIGG